MVADPTTDLSRITNPLVTSKQLLRYRGTDSSDVTTDYFATCVLSQAAGVLLRLPQEVIATAIILLRRYQVGYVPNASDKQSSRYLSEAAIYLAAKSSFTPLGPRSIVNVYAFLFSKASPLAFINGDAEKLNQPSDPSTYFVSEGDYERERLNILHHESLLLAGIGFDVHVALPYTLALTYLSALSVSNSERLAARVFEHLNGALTSPQLLYLTHQPNVIATAAIYLAAKEVEVKLIGSVNWWEVFDVDREALGFVVMAMGSLKAFAETEKEKWKERKLNNG